MYKEDGLDDAAITRILTGTRRIAMVGASNRPNRPSNEVMQFLLAQGYHVTPVNPGLLGQVIHGQAVVATLAEAAPLDMVDLFRNADDLGPDVDEAVRLGARTIWMQIGVINELAAIAGRNGGAEVVMNRCPKIEIGRLGIRQVAA